MPMQGRKVLAEFVGTAILVATVVGSGIMATNLTKDVGLQLLINALATIFSLGILIALLGPISGAHFNPAVSLVERIFSRLTVSLTLLYIAAQIIGGVAGTVIANLMFKHSAINASHHQRNGVNLFLGEVVATAGLLFIITLLTKQKRGAIAPILIPLWIGAAYFFTSSTSFANPAVTFARAWSDTFSGIALASVPAFILAQLIGAGVGTLLALGVTND